MSDPIKHSRRPPTWAEFRGQVRHRVLHPLLYFEWLTRHLAYFLGHWSLLEVLEYAGRFTVLVAVIVYFTETGERRQQKHYQAWQVINTAQGKGGNGGRIDALEQLNEDGVSLTGVDLSIAFLQGVHLDGAELRRAVLTAADLRNAHFHGTTLTDANLHSANLRYADLRGADLTGADLTDSDLTGADLTKAKVGGAMFKDADLTEAKLDGIEGWQTASGLGSATLANIKNAAGGLARSATMPAAPRRP